jgi:hypothetical protein
MVGPQEHNRRARSAGQPATPAPPRRSGCTDRSICTRAKPGRRDQQRRCGTSPWRVACCVVQHQVVVGVGAVLVAEEMRKQCA